MRHAYEIKWNPTRKTKVPVAWRETYENSKFQIINRDNYMDWIEV